MFWTVTGLCRYHVFLQLKKDILEGRLVPPLKSAAILASYAVQCEQQHDVDSSVCTSDTVRPLSHRKFLS